MKISELLDAAAEVASKLDHIDKGFAAVNLDAAGKPAACCVFGALHVVEFGGLNGFSYERAQTDESCRMHYTAANLLAQEIARRTGSGDIVAWSNAHTGEDTAELLRTVAEQARAKGL